MNKKLCVPIALLIILLLLCSCGRANENLELALCGSYAVPGFFSSDLKGELPSVEVLETDEYGRTLFEFTAISSVSGEKETALVICQKRDGDFVYFYEDICYRVAPYEDQDISELKAQNDWTKKLDMWKMSRRKNQITFDLCIRADHGFKNGQVAKEFCEYMEIERDDINNLNFQDISSSGHGLFHVHISSDNEPRHYFVIVSPEYDISVLEVTGTIPSSTEISGFKIASGWGYRPEGASMP